MAVGFLALVCVTSHCGLKSDKPLPTVRTAGWGARQGVGCVGFYLFIVIIYWISFCILNGFSVCLICSIFCGNALWNIRYTQISSILVTMCLISFLSISNKCTQSVYYAPLNSPQAFCPQVLTHDPSGYSACGCKFQLEIEKANESCREAIKRIANNLWKCLLSRARLVALTSCSLLSLVHSRQTVLLFHWPQQGLKCKEKMNMKMI